MISISESAAVKLAEILEEEKQSKNTKIRVYVEGGGCSGMQYGFTFDETQSEDDFEISAGATKLLVDAMSITYLQGAEIDYVDDLNGSQFKIKNPNATTTCGCGSSFSPY